MYVECGWGGDIYMDWRGSYVCVEIPWMMTCTSLCADEHPDVAQIQG